MVSPFKSEFYGVESSKLLGAIYMDTEIEIEIKIGGRILEIPGFAAVDVDVAVVGFVLSGSLILDFKECTCMSL